METDMSIFVLGEVRVAVSGSNLPLPASRKTRALLAFLAATNRPHRRERLCELLWDLPDDPKAALRWSLTKLRKVVDTLGDQRIVADRERVQLQTDGMVVDLRDVHNWLEQRHAPTDLDSLEALAHSLEQRPFAGLDGAGGPEFDVWLTAEREDLRLARCEVLRHLVAHPELDPVSGARWRRSLREIDPTYRDSDEHLAMPSHKGGVAGSDVTPTSQADDIPEAHVATPDTPRLERRALRTQRIGFCTVPDGTKIAYASVGDGPPILKAANWLTHLEFDWQSPIWGQSFVDLSRRRTFIRYDERGCGLSDWDVSDISFDAFVEDLEIVADTLGLERFPLLGISQGAAVSIEYAARHPDRVSGLILVSGYAAGWRIHATPDEQERRDAVLALTKVGWGTDNPAYRHIFSKTFMPDARPDDLVWFDEFQRLTTSAENAARFQDAFGYIDVRDRLKDVLAPTIVFHSKFDQRIPLDQGRDLARGIPNAEFVALDSKNHILVESEPALRIFSDVTRQFLQDNGI